MLPEPAVCVEEVKHSCGRLVIVDDDPAVRSSLKFSFELEGFDIQTFANAELLAEEAVIDDPSCLIIDYRLPGMNGLQLLALVRSRGCRSPAIIITSHPNRKLREQIAAANAILVEKPLLCDALRSSVRALMPRAGSL
jgi:two-component system response regulator FixJ